MAKTNYQFEKRQRDLAKKRKQEEKQKQKLANKAVADRSKSDAEGDAPEEDGKGAALPGTETLPDA